MTKLFNVHKATKPLKLRFGAYQVIWYQQNALFKMGNVLNCLRLDMDNLYFKM